MNPRFPQTRSADPENRRRFRLLVLVTLAFVLVGLWTIRPRAVRAAVAQVESLISGKAGAAHAATVHAARNPNPAPGN